MSQTPNTAIAVIGIDIGKNSFHVVGHDARVHAGQNAKYSVRADVFCSASKLRYCSTQPALRICATNGSGSSCAWTSGLPDAWLCW